MKRRGKWINPTSLKMTRGRPVARKHRKAFKAMVAERTGRLAAIKLKPDAAEAVQAPAPQPEPTGDPATP